MLIFQRYMDIVLINVHTLSSCFYMFAPFCKPLTSPISLHVEWFSSKNPNINAPQVTKFMDISLIAIVNPKKTHWSHFLPPTT